MEKVFKTAISIPMEDYRLVESLRKETGKSRSKILIDAFHAWIKSRRKEEIEKQYEESYRKRPEKLDDIKAFINSSSSVWGKDEW